MRSWHVILIGTTRRQTNRDDHSRGLFLTLLFFFKFCPSLKVLLDRSSLVFCSLEMHAFFGKILSPSDDTRRELRYGAVCSSLSNPLCVAAAKGNFMYVFFFHFFV